MRCTIFVASFTLDGVILIDCVNFLKFTYKKVHFYAKPP